MTVLLVAVAFVLGYLAGRSDGRLRRDEELLERDFDRALAKLRRRLRG